MEDNAHSAQRGTWPQDFCLGGFSAARTHGAARTLAIPEAGSPAIPSVETMAQTVEDRGLQTNGHFGPAVEVDLLRFRLEAELVRSPNQ